jgi:hypothetical protein
MKKKSQEEFIKEIMDIHSDKYDYSKVKYINNNTNVILICPEHGEFLKKPIHLINRGQGCPLCSRDEISSKQRMGLNNFITKAKEIHGDKYDYSLVNYKNNRTKVKIVCPEHGEFEQLPTNHLRGKGCKYCGGTSKMDTKLFIIKAKEMHGDKYDYSLVNYKVSREPVTIICSEHGEFEQTPNNHLSKGQGCPKCLGKIIDTETFINKAKVIHGDKYDYSKVEYSSQFEKVKIICPEHGEINVTPHYHINGFGCKSCSNSLSLLEKSIHSFITDLKINCIENDKAVLNGKELDIYIPSHKVAIEFNGLYLHSNLFVDNDYHLNKTEECEKLGIQLVHIFEDEWLHNEGIVKSRIKNILGLTKNKFYARKCEIKEVPVKVKTKFLNDNHIQGAIGSKVNLGLYHNDELLSIMTFGKRPILNSLEFELLRFCNKLDTSVVGGASKLLKHFIKHYQPKEIISYADRRWSQGNMYEQLKFKFIENTQPNWFVVKGKYRENRVNYQKHRLVEMGYDKNKTANQILNENNMYKIYDCGTKKFTLYLQY